jgi:hypothetical protein
MFTLAVEMSSAGVLLLHHSLEVKIYDKIHCAKQTRQTVGAVMHRQKSSKFQTQIHLNSSLPWIRPILEIAGGSFKSFERKKVSKNHEKNFC